MPSGKIAVHSGTGGRRVVSIMISNRHVPTTSPKKPQVCMISSDPIDLNATEATPRNMSTRTPHCDNMTGLAWHDHHGKRQASLWKPFRPDGHTGVHAASHSIAIIFESPVSQ
ncbi:unnamed protein product [Cercospora beticola]|nr:unnamed protein product [Cercospora beticola]